MGTSRNTSYHFGCWIVEHWLWYDIVKCLLVVSLRFISYSPFFRTSIRVNFSFFLCSKIHLPQNQDYVGLLVLVSVGLCCMCEPGCSVVDDCLLEDQAQRVVRSHCQQWWKPDGERWTQLAALPAEKNIILNMHVN
jgi:hypothetical protein